MRKIEAEKEVAGYLTILGWKIPDDSRWLRSAVDHYRMG
jgi:hypothetical protein